MLSVLDLHLLHMRYKPYQKRVNELVLSIHSKGLCRENFAKGFVFSSCSKKASKLYFTILWHQSEYKFIKLENDNNQSQIWTFPLASSVISSLNQSDCWDMWLAPIILSFIILGSDFPGAWLKIFLHTAHISLWKWNFNVLWTKCCFFKSYQKKHVFI